MIHSHSLWLTHWRQTGARSSLNTAFSLFPGILEDRIPNVGSWRLTGNRGQPPRFRFHAYRSNSNHRSWDVSIVSGGNFTALNPGGFATLRIYAHELKSIAGIYEQFHVSSSSVIQKRYESFCLTRQMFGRIYKVILHLLHQQGTIWFGLDRWWLEILSL
jgi:hypothetical protein